jgi:hypothetical protein
MLPLAHSAPKINWGDLTQIPALPLGSWLKTDPWDDRVHQLDAKLYAPRNPRDKMPFEVTRVFYNLQRYSVSNDLHPSADAAPADQPAAGGVPASTTTPGQKTTPPTAAVPAAPAESPAHRVKTG